MLKQAQAPKSPQRVEARFNSRPSRSFRPLWALAIAAALVGGLLLWSALFYVAEPVESAGLWTTFTAEKGRRFLQLEDGTQVVLAPGAKLQYAAGFGVGHREVEVEGQFFFHVAKNEQLPFLIQGPDTETRVTGTSFNLHAASGKFLLEVATGSVEVRDLAQAHATAVLAGERLQVEAHVWAQEEIGTDQPFLWTERAWAFESAPLYEVFRAMERAKGIHIEVADSGLLACRFTGKIGAESGAEVLRMIAQAMQLELTETQTNTFFIRGRPC
ncbi:putative anti-sigma factor [Nitritalea halalkaliphila LW7]|uniref:Putative anti-sigma factor n=1 Tax=Nitritalea halalkaliphila LW7 TaxID=1189621 RepID=I5BVN2_9BACT|nr:FecR domain-containing protein [Nitritalea halalkaliphila]EIM73634.1 putative anti-sigma factor [Nitritalea halalkaliphila LW7]